MASAEQPVVQASLEVKRKQLMQAFRRNPEVYPRVRSSARRASIRRFPYGLFYVVEEEVVVVIGVFHAHRDPRCWSDRV